MHCFFLMVNGVILVFGRRGGFLEPTLDVASVELAKVNAE